LGSQYKNHKELNHYYDNVLNDNSLDSFTRVLNETKENLDVSYNPNLSEKDIADLTEARDEIKKAILKEPDLENKITLGNEALKIQNQLDAHDAVNGIIQNKEALIDYVNSNPDINEEQKKFYTNKIAAIADHFDNSEFGLKKKELNAKIEVAQKRLDDASLSFTNLKKASDRVRGKNRDRERRKELDSLNNELTDLITKKTEQDAIQEQGTNESVLRTEQPELELQGVVNAKPEEVTTSLKVSDALNEPSSVFVYDGKKGQLTTIGKTLVLETPDEVIDIAYDLDNVSDQTLEDLGVHKEEELDFKLNDDNSIELKGKSTLIIIATLSQHLVKTRMGTIQLH